MLDESQNGRPAPADLYRFGSLAGGSARHPSMKEPDPLCQGSEVGAAGNDVSDY